MHSDEICFLKLILLIDKPVKRVQAIKKLKTGAWHGAHDYNPSCVTITAFRMHSWNWRREPVLGSRQEDGDRASWQYAQVYMSLQPRRQTWTSSLAGLIVMNPVYFFVKLQTCSPSGFIFMNLIYFFENLWSEGFRTRCGWPEEQSSFPHGLVSTGLVITFLCAVCLIHDILHDLSMVALLLIKVQIWKAIWANYKIIHSSFTGWHFICSIKKFYSVFGICADTQTTKLMWFYELFIIAVCEELKFNHLVADVDEGAEGPADNERAHAGGGTTSEDTSQRCSALVRHTASAAADTGPNASSSECV